MGRGRQKAKQTKVARELKYFTPDTNLSALERELRGDTSAPAPVFEDDDDDDDYEDYVDPYAPEDEEEDEDGPDLSVWAEYAEEATK